ncbi:MAG: hypothetical protein IPH13_08850 [Planctomycetes bacterium]|nr:hypothetical protein [Planctomycetota bacterium]
MKFVAALLGSVILLSPTLAAAGWGSTTVQLWHGHNGSPGSFVNGLPYWSHDNLPFHGNVPSMADYYWGCMIFAPTGSPFPHQAKAELQFKRQKNGATWFALDTALLFGTSGSAFSSDKKTDGTYSAEAVKFHISNIDPGIYSMRLKFSPIAPAGQEATYSDITLVNITLPNTTDIYATKFDVLGENDICSGGQAQFRVTLTNLGEQECLGNADVKLYYSTSSSMANAQLYQSFPVPSVPHQPYSSTPYTFNFQYPLDKGKLYWAVKATPQSSAFNWSPAWSNKDEVVIYADLALTWSSCAFSSGTLSPSGNEYIVPQNSKVQYSFKVCNNGALNSPYTAKAVLEVKRKGQAGWQVIDGSARTIGELVGCNSTEVTFGPFETPLKCPWADADDVGKIRAIRVRLDNTAAEKKQNNNYSEGTAFIVAPGLEFTYSPTMSSDSEAVIQASATTTGGSYTWHLEPNNLVAKLANADVPNDPLLPVTQIGCRNLRIKSPFAYGNQDQIRLRCDYTYNGVTTQGWVYITVGGPPGLFVKYNAFIMCEIVELPASVQVISGYDFANGDNRQWAIDGSSRFSTLTTIQGGLTSTTGSTIYTANTSSFFAEADLLPLDPGMEDFCPEKYCKWTHSPNLAPLCLGPSNVIVTTTNTANVTVNPLWDSTAGSTPAYMVTWTIEAYTGCVALSAPVDLRFDLIAWQPDPFQIARYKLLVQHDPFPWHEIYPNGSAPINLNNNGTNIAPWDPCLHNTTVENLLNTPQVTYQFPPQGFNEW